MLSNHFTYLVSPSSDVPHFPFVFIEICFLISNYIFNRINILSLDVPIFLFSIRFHRYNLFSWIYALQQVNCSLFFFFSFLWKSLSLFYGFVLFPIISISFVFFQYLSFSFSNKSNHLCHRVVPVFLIHSLKVNNSLHLWSEEISLVGEWISLDSNSSIVKFTAQRMKSCPVHSIFTPKDFFLESRVPFERDFSTNLKYTLPLRDREKRVFSFTSLFYWLGLWIHLSINGKDSQWWEK